MPKKSEHKKYSKKSATKKHTKKNYETRNSIKGGFPPANILSQFPISDSDIQNFRRVFTTPMDCVINAMQIVGMLDNLTGNLVRISSAGSSGFSKEQIEKIFILYNGKYFDFKPTNSFDEFSNYLRQHLMPGHVVFAGYSGHVFLIGRQLDGTILYIDPQLDAYCDVERPQCANYIKSANTWYLLHHSERQLTEDELRSIGFTI